MTSIFDDIAFSVGKSKGDARAKSDRLHEAAFFWDSIQSEATIFHVNAYLKVCLECAGVGGWERAWNLFESLGDPLAKKADAPEDAMEAHMQRLYPSSITFTMMLKLCSRSGLQSAMDCGLQLWSEIRKIVKADKSKNPAKIKIDGPMLNAVLGLFARAPSDADAVKGLQVVEEFYGLPIKHSDPIESPSTKRFIDIRTLTLLIQFATRLKYPELGLVWFEIVDKAAQDKKVQIRDEGLYKCVAGLLLPARQHDKLQALLDQDPKAPFEVTLRNCAAAVHSASWKDKNKWWTRAEEAAMKFGWDNLRFNDVLNFLEVSVLTGHHREGARLAIQRKKDIIQWSHDQLDKALTRRTQNPNLKLEDSDNVLDLKLLKLVQLICSKKEDMLLSKEKGVFLELLEKQVKQILDDWESITSKTKVYLEKDDEIDDGTPPKHRGERREFKKSAATNRKQQDSEKDVDRSSEEDPQVALRRRQFLLKASRQRE